MPLTIRICMAQSIRRSIDLLLPQRSLRWNHSLRWNKCLDSTELRKSKYKIRFYWIPWVDFFLILEDIENSFFRTTPMLETEITLICIESKRILLSWHDLLILTIHVSLNGGFTCYNTSHIYKSFLLLEKPCPSRCRRTLATTWLWVFSWLKYKGPTF